MRFSSRYGVLKNTKNRIINLSTAFVLAATGISGASPLFLSQKATALTGTITVCSAGCDYNTVAAAVTSAPAGSTILVNEDQTITSTVLVSKQLTITGTAGVTITTSGGNMVFTTTADGVVISNLSFYKSDKVLQSFINVQGDNTTISGNTFAGQYTLAANDSTSRALDVSGSAADLIVTGNTFNMVRQPAYLNNGSAGTISNNHTSQTRGWVVEAGSDFDFVGNTWGSDGNRNAIDIAVIAGSPNNYTDVAGISNSNNGAAVQNQVSGVLSTVYVDSSASAGGNGYWQTPYKTITSSLSAVATGGRVVVAPGTYYENVSVTKAITIEGAGAATTKIVGTNGNATPLTFATSNATVNGFTITHEYTTSELDAWNFNNNGVTFSQATTGNTLSNSVVSLNRNGVYINNAQGNKLIGNTITNNRTAVNLTNTVDNTQIKNNIISDNWTIGLVMYAATPSLATDLSTVTVSGNTFDQNWYSEILIKDAPTFTGALNVTNNTFTDSPVTYSTSTNSSLNEPGFAALKPESLGGDAVKPAQELPTLRIYNAGDATFDYTSSTLDINGTETVLTGDDTTVSFPADTVITANDPGAWNGVVNAPSVVTTTVPLPSGATQGVAIEVGSPDTSLTFDQAAQLVIAGEAGKLVGYVHNGNFVKITAICSANTQAAGNALPAGGDCYINAGNDLVVWTKHFTTFATYTPDTTKPTAAFTAPLNASVHKGLVSISVDASDSDSGLKNLQIVMRDSTNAVVGNWSYNVQTGTATTIQGTGTISLSGDAASGTVTVQNVNTAALTNGKYNLRLFVTDVVGNSNSAIYGNFYADNSSPDGSIVAPTEEQKGDTTVIVNLSEVGMAGLGVQQLVMRDSDGNVAGNWSYNVKTGATQTISGPTAVFDYVGDQTSGQLKITFSSSQLDNGTYSLRLFTKDQLGNGRSNIYGSVKFDNVAPGITFGSPAPGSVARDLTISASFDGTGSNMKQYGFDVSGPNGLNFSTRNYHVDQSTVTLTGFDLCAAQYYGDSCSSDLDDGTYTIRAKAYDKAGNRNTSAYITVVIDRSAPDGSFDVSNTPVSGTTVIKVNLDDVGEAGLGVQQVVLRDASGTVIGNWQYNVETGVYRLIKGNGTATYTGDDNNGNLEISFDTTGLNGDFNLRLFTKDQLGNGRSNIYGHLTVDNDGPVVTFNSYGQSGNIIHPVVTATDSNGPLTYSWTTDPNVTISDVNALDPTFTVLRDGTYTFTLTATDGSGNASTKNFSFTYTTPVTPTTLTGSAFTAVNTSSTGTGTDSAAPTSLADSNGEVLGTSSGIASDATKKSATTNSPEKKIVSSSAFLGLGWYWLIVLAAVAALGYLAVVRRADR